MCNTYHRQACLQKIDDFDKVLRAKSIVEGLRDTCFVAMCSHFRWAEQMMVSSTDDPGSKKIYSDFATVSCNWIFY